MVGCPTVLYGCAFLQKVGVTARTISVAFRGLKLVEITRKNGWLPRYGYDLIGTEGAKRAYPPGHLLESGVHIDTLSRRAGCVQGQWTIGEKVREDRKKRPFDN